MHPLAAWAALRQRGPVHAAARQGANDHYGAVVGLAPRNAGEGRRRGDINTLFVTVAACLSAAALVLLPGPAAGADSVARALGAELTRTELAEAGGDQQRLVRLRDWIWERVHDHFIEEQGLAATPGDIAELVAYHREFQRRDRVQRARKLEELDARLAGGDLEANERARLEEFRRVLARMAERERRAGAEADDPGGDPDLFRPWIEFWKGNRALYERYGGIVAATRAGPAAWGARAALVAEYEQRGLVEVFDARLRRALHELMARRPAAVVPSERVDFTPYWKKPIPSSYFRE